MKINLENLELKINYKFSNQKLLIRSMTHRSYSIDSVKNEWIDDNETLEFLGDAILNFICASNLFKSIKNITEGSLSKLRSAYVCKKNLAKYARKINLSKYLRVSSAMRSSGSIELPTILSNTLEALIGAVYLDGGIESASNLINYILGEPPKKIAIIPKDSKTLLQEKIQQICGLTPFYLVKNSFGPAHMPKFEIEIYANKKKIGLGYGKNKKIAALDGAKSALKYFSKLSDNKIKFIIFKNENK